MARYSTIANDGDGFDFQDFNRSVQLPIKELCYPTVLDWLINDCDKTWNCNKLQMDLPFNMVYESCDKIMLQFRFADEYNVDPTKPDSGWGGWLTVVWRDKDGNDISTDHAQYSSRSMVGWDGYGSYQLIEIDTDLLAADEYFCFSIEVSSNKLTEEGYVASQVICSESFGLAKCDTVVKVQGIYTKFDCFGNWYGNPEYYDGDKFTYDNTLKFDGFLRDSGFSIKKEVVNGRSINSISKHIWSLTFRMPVPNYVKNTLYGQLLGGSKLLIDDEEYIIDSAQAEPFGNMYKVQIEVYKECELSDNC